MLDFVPMRLEDIDRLKSYFDCAVNRICDNTVGTAVMWRNYFSTQYAIFNSTLVMKVELSRGSVAFSVPLGSDVAGALGEIEIYCAQNNIPMVIYAATSEDLDILSSLYQIKAVKEEGWSDYLYSADDLCNMKGRRYAGQRNHINAFEITNPGWRFEEMNGSNIKRAIDFYEQPYFLNQKDSELFLSEQKIVIEVLHNFEAYHMYGGFISLADGSIVAMAIGETVGDTIFVHIEKAMARVRGAYQLITREFPKHFRTDNVKYINREEDLGEEGLRTSKLSYHPCELKDKFTVYIKNRYRA